MQRFVIGNKDANAGFSWGEGGGGSYRTINFASKKTKHMFFFLNPMYLVEKNSDIYSLCVLNDEMHRKNALYA